jgi:hypothetical protein
MSSFDSSRPVVLFALLDWGMGHATRTAPLIQFAVDQGWAVHVATKGTALAFLRTQFSPEAISFHTKPGPDITYAKRGTWMKIAAQVPEFLSSIRKETSWTAEFVARHGITHIVSDNCYGVHHPDIPCVLMSHQLQLPVPNAVAALASTFVNKHAAQFRSVWIPDDESVGLSGALTSHHQLPHAEYVGILSRLSPHAAQGNWRTVGMVSGPEPHRKLMELALLRWMKGIPGPCLLIAGRPGDKVEVNDHVTVWPDPSAEDLAGALCGAETIVCRSGYSSLLDLAALGQRAILVPTPGQPEQLLLARHWAQTFGMATCTQHELESGLVPVVSGSPAQLEPNTKAQQALLDLVLNA